MTSPRPGTRSLPYAVRKRKLRLAGLAEWLRLKREARRET